MKKVVGKQGEALATEYLIKLGYKIVERNFQTRFGEIDIIAYDEKRNLVFVEVRTKSTALFGLAEESITAKKKAKLHKTAHIYLLRNPTLNYRFDLIAINFFEKQPIKHFKNIIGTCH